MNFFTGSTLFCSEKFLVLTDLSVQQQLILQSVSLWPAAWTRRNTERDMPVLPVSGSQGELAFMLWLWPKRRSSPSFLSGGVLSSLLRFQRENYDQTPRQRAKCGLHIDDFPFQGIGNLLFDRRIRA